MTFFPSACIWTCPGDPKDVLRQIKETAFHYIDVTADFTASAEFVELARSLGLKVGNVLLDRRPSGAGSSNDASSSRQQIDGMRLAIQRCAPLEPQAVCIKPCSAAKGLKSFGQHAVALAGEAQQKGVRLCIENHPRSALPGARDVLRLLEELKHPNLHLLLDTGHALLAGEDPAGAIVAAGARIGGIQFNDNNGRSDKHWAPLEGRLTEEQVRRALEALEKAGYKGTLGIEVLWDRASVISGLSKSRNMLLRLQIPGPIKSVAEPEARRKH